MATPKHKHIVMMRPNYRWIMDSQIAQSDACFLAYLLPCQVGITEHGFSKRGL